MELDRALIKSQARQLIKGNVFKLFLICFIVSLLTGNIVSTVQNVANRSSAPSNSYSSGSYEDYFNDFGNEFGDEFDFGYSEPSGGYSSPASSAASVVTGAISTVAFLATIFLAPLTIGLCALFLLFIKGDNKSLGDGLTFVFKTAFDKDYWQRVLLNLLVGIFTFLWALLFIIPGIVYAFKCIFANYIMAENSKFTWREAINLSKKMTNGHKGEIFVLFLSFIPWYLLIGITLGFAGIYVAPYMATTMALYYENFKQRGLQNGELTPDDFVPMAEKALGYNPYQAPVAPVNAYQPPVQQAPAAPVNPYQVTQANPYAPAQPQPAAPQSAPQQGTYFEPTAAPQPVPQAPVQPVQPQYQPPQESYYQPPVQQAPPVTAAPAQTAPVQPEPQQYQAPAAPSEPAPGDYYQPPTFGE